MKIHRFVLFVIAQLILFYSISYAQDDVWFAKGQKSFNEKKYKEAINSFTKSISFSKKKDKHTYYYRGMCYLYLNNLERATNDFTLAINLDTNYADAYNNRGLAYFLLNDFGMAFWNYDKAIEIDPKFGQAYLNRASIFLEINNYVRAEIDFKKAIEYDKDNPEIYFNQGRLFYRQKKYKEAVGEFTKSLNMGLKNPKVFYNRANAYYKMNEIKLAVEDYSKAIELNPDDMDAINNRAMAYDALGETEKAKKDRDILKKNSFLPEKMTALDSIKFKTIENSTGEISLSIPEDWKGFNTSDSDVVQFIITPEKLEKNNYYFNLGARLVINKNMKKHYNVSQPDELISFWQGSNAKNVEDYFDYTIFSQKSINKVQYSGYINHVKIQPTKDNPPLQMYEIVMAKDDVLFFGYFQSPDTWFAYYRQIFDYVINSLNVK